MIKGFDKRYYRKRWKRVKGLPIIGVRFLTDEIPLGYFKILKLWKCQTYHPFASHIDGTHWFEEGMMLVITSDGRKFKMPFYPWLKAYDDNEKSFSKYYDEFPWLK